MNETKKKKWNENKLLQIKIVTIVIACVLSNNDKYDTLLYFEHMPAKLFPNSIIHKS